MLVMKWFQSILLFGVASAVLAQDESSTYPYVIDSFVVNGTLNKDSSFLVTETLDVTFNESRHGIFRKIPFTFDTGKGIARKTLIDQINVTDPSGAPYTKKITKEGAYINIRIGDKDIDLPPGTQKTYAISYRVQNAVNWFGKDQEWDPHAELYWNMTGNEWDTAINSFRYEINFPDNSQPKAQVFAGFFGSTASTSLNGIGKASEIEATQTTLSLNRTTLSGERQTPLSPGEAVTFVLSVPEAVISRPNVATQTWWAFTANSGFFLPFFVLLVLVPWWMLKGRDPSGKPCEVMFEPPDGLTATECGSLLDERVDMRDISAGLVTLAVKGYLTIHATEAGLFGNRDTTIKMTTKAFGNDLGLFETKLLSKLKQGGDEIKKSELTSLVGSQISDLQQTVYQSLVDKNYYRIAPNQVMAGGCALGVAVALLIGFVLHTFFSLGADEASWFIGAVVSLGIVLVFARLIPRRTQLGADTRSQIVGFENAMRGRKNYMEWVADKKIAEAKFEEYLPYAIAFGLVQQWSDTFKEVVTHAPGWYYSPYGMNNWSTHAFADDFSSVTNSIGYAANTPPRTSSSSGSSGFSGGSSGGGFGGGGGGSW